MHQAAWSTRSVPRLDALVPNGAGAMRRVQAPIRRCVALGINHPANLLLMERRGVRYRPSQVFAQSKGAVVMLGRKRVALAIAVLGLGVTGVATAGVKVGSAQGAAHAGQLDISLLEGKLTVSATTLAAGKVTLVVVNKGTKTHGLAIMGNGMSPKRTPTIAIGKTARLIVTLTAGKYHIWDPVRSSMSHAKFLTVKGASAGTSSSGSSGTSSNSSSGSGSGSTGSSTGTGTAGANDDGMAGMEH